VKRSALFILALLFLRTAQAADWLIASPAPRADAGGHFEIVVIAPPGETPPEELRVRIQADVAEIDLELKAVAHARHQVRWRERLPVRAILREKNRGQSPISGICAPAMGNRALTPIFL
jgi:hypothetical protein